MPCGIAPGRAHDPRLADAMTGLLPTLVGRPCSVPCRQDGRERGRGAGDIGFIPFMAAVVVAAWLGGFLPGVLEPSRPCPRGFVFMGRRGCLRSMPESDQVAVSRCSGLVGLLASWLAWLRALPSTCAGCDGHATSRATGGRPQRPAARGAAGDGHPGSPGRPQRRGPRRWAGRGHQSAAAPTGARCSAWTRGQRARRRHGPGIRRRDHGGRAPLPVDGSLAVTASHAPAWPPSSREPRGPRAAYGPPDARGGIAAPRRSPSCRST